MSVTVGTNSYVSIADADSYFASINNTTWAEKSDSEKEYALVKACNYIEAKYAGNWEGYISSVNQALSWPRSGIYDPEGRTIESDEYPFQVKRAQCELALKTFTEDIFADLDAREDAIVEKKVDAITTKWAQGATPQKTYVYVDMLLRPFLMRTGNQANLIRG